MSPAPANAPMPAAWCAARRAEIQAYVDGTERKNHGETRTFLIELLAQFAALAARSEAAERELGTLYAHIFQDGGHRQAELTGHTVAAMDWLTGQPTGEVIPALPALALDVLHAWFARGEAAEAELAAMRRWHEERMAGFAYWALQDCDDESFGNGVYWYLGLNRFERTPQPNSPLARWPETPTQS